MQQRLEGDVRNFGFGDGQSVGIDLGGEFAPTMECGEEIFEFEQ